MILKKLFELGLHRTEPKMERTEATKALEPEGSKEKGVERAGMEVSERKKNASAKGSVVPPSRQGKIAGTALIDRFLHKKSQERNLDHERNTLNSGDETNKLRRENAERILSDFVGLGGSSSAYKVRPNFPLVTPDSEVGRHAIALLEDIRTSRISAENKRKTLQSVKKSLKLR